jgi:hypothetical protein
MENDAIKRSVDSLQRIYSMIIALAIAYAISTVFIDEHQYLRNLDAILPNLPKFLTFIVIIVPFFHGMNRHLDRCYLTKECDPIKGALLYDFFFFFVESVILFIFAGTLRSPGLTCYKVLAILLVIDSCWAILSCWVHYKSFKNTPGTWCVINAISVGLGVIVYFHHYFDESGKVWVFFVMALARSIVDYKLCWRFYFPEATSSQIETAKGD